MLKRLGFISVALLCAAGLFANGAQGTTTTTQGTTSSSSGSGQYKQSPYLNSQNLLLVG
jgi:hypothetical protein